MPKEGFLESIIEVFSSVMVGKVLTDLDKRVRDYLADFIHRLVRRIMLLVSGVIIALVGLVFLFVAAALYLNEFFGSKWMGWGVLGIVITAAGLLASAVSRR
jgi:hypothetical protein